MTIHNHSDYSMHKHQCPNCKSVWQHPKPSADVDNVKAHTCPKCGTEEYWHANPDLPVDYPFKGWNALENEAQKPIRNAVTKLHASCHKYKKHILAGSSFVIFVAHYAVPEFEIHATVLIGFLTVELA